MIYWRVLTIVFGAVPATWLSLWAAAGVFWGVVFTIAGAHIGLLAAVWGLAGLYGAASLWAIGLGFMNRTSIRGLVVGTAAIVPLTLASLSGHSWPNDWLNSFYVASILPAIVAVAWLVDAARKGDYLVLFVSSASRGSEKTGPSAA